MDYKIERFKQAISKLVYTYFIVPNTTTPEPIPTTTSEKENTTTVETTTPATTTAYIPGKGIIQHFHITP